MAIPGRKIEELDVRRGEFERLAKGAGALAIARDMNENNGPALRACRQGARQIGDAKSVEAVGNGGQRQRAALGKLGDSTFEISHDVTSIRKLLRSAG